jgi:hypothetical protein
VTRVFLRVEKAYVRRAAATSIARASTGVVRARTRGPVGIRGGA